MYFCRRGKKLTFLVRYGWENQDYPSTKAGTVAVILNKIGHVIDQTDLIANGR